MDSPLLRPQPNPVPIANHHNEDRSHHSHDAAHVDDRDSIKRKLRRAIALSLSLMILEIAGGLLAHSLAIVTDAAHLLSDVSGFAVSLFAIALSQRVPTLDYTYGYHQAEIIGALTSVLIVWAMTGVLIFEAVNRFIVLQPVDGRLMLIMAVIGLVVNFALFGTLHHDHGHSHDHSHSHDHDRGHSGHRHSHDGPCNHDHNHHAPRLAGSDEAVEAASRGQTNLALDAAVIHIIGDIVQSLGVLLAALLIVWQPFDIGYTEDGISHWYYADPMCTILFSFLVMFTTFRTTKQSISVLMHRVPEHVDLADFDTKLRDMPGVKCIHDVHVWMVGSKNVIATAHIVVTDIQLVGQVLEDAKKVAHNLGIGHSTFQIEVDGIYNHAEETFGSIHSRDELCCSMPGQNGVEV
jgi:zinc transporter 2